MSREDVKKISTKPEKFIPKSHAEDQSLSEDAKEIKDRPLVFMWTKLTREDRYNISSLIKAEKVDEDTQVQNLGTLTRYIWDHCVVEVLNVLLDGEAVDSVKGLEKNRLFNTSGMDTEIVEVVRHIQTQSSLSEVEAKN
jgi:hypothetical protein